MPASCFLTCIVVVRLNFVFSNCEIVYSDADLPTADAVLFHLHKVLVLIQQAKCIGNKLVKARKTQKLPGTLGLKKFGLLKLWVEKVVPRFGY